MERDPLEDWLFRTSCSREHDKREQELLRRDLADLEAWLDSPPALRRREMPHVRGRWFSSAQIEPHELPRVQELYRRVVAAKGAGKSFAEEALLSLIACALEPSDRKSVV